MHYFVIYKPYGYLSQFTPEKDGDLTLKDLYPFPSDVYPVGRLDKDSEGLSGPIRRIHYGLSYQEIINISFHSHKWENI